MNGLNQKVRTLRAWLGLSQTEFGDKVGVSITTVSAWEAGRGNPKPENVEKIKTTFNVELDSIYIDCTAP